MVLFASAPGSPFDPNGLSSRDFTVGDFNNDNNLDIVTANYNSDDISVFLGDGLGGFATPLLFEGIDVYVRGIDTADFDNDGNLDLVVAKETDGATTYSILLGDGAGSFGTVNNLTAGGLVQDVTTGDFDLDGNIDLAFALGTVGGKARIEFGNGDGGFTVLEDTLSGALSGFGFNPNEIIAEDLNLDGFLDLIVTFEGRSSNEGLAVIMGNNPALVDENNPDSIPYFEEPFIYQTSDPTFLKPQDTSIGDFNNDSIPDLVIVGNNFVDGNVVSILLGSGDNQGSFTILPFFQLPIVESEFGNSGPLNVDVADFNNDGNDDLVIQANRFGNVDDGESILLGNGTGNFSETTRTFDGRIGALNGVIAADFNNDNNPDFASLYGFFGGSSADDLFVYLNNQNTLEGTNRGDTLVGSTERDTLKGLGGNDSLTGNDENDRLIGGGGRDTLEGGAGRDRLEGNNGNDVLLGGAGGDDIFGGGGNDTLTGGTGFDKLFGRSGRDTFVIEPSNNNSDRSVIGDYLDGVDKIGLAGDLSFSDLNIFNNNANNATFIRDTRVNKTLAVLSNVDASAIDSSDFVDI